LDRGRAAAVLVNYVEAPRRFPELGVAMTGPFAGYRATVVDLYRIVYRLRARATVQVNFIRHCRRAPLA